jgi:hypothetical protein
MSGESCECHAAIVSAARRAHHPSGLNAGDGAVNPPNVDFDHHALVVSVQ